MIPSVLLNKPPSEAPSPPQDIPVSVANLQTLTVQQIASLPAADLARLQQQATANFHKAKAAVDWLDGALSLRYKDRATQARAQAEKDTGTVRFEDNGFTVVAELPKRVKWDQQRLKEIADLIATSWGENPADYVKVKFDVSERAYDSWPPRLKELFTPARTVETGKASYELVHIDGRRA